MAKKKNVIKISKKAIKFWQAIITIIIIGAIIFSIFNYFKQQRISQIINERNLYCNTTWQDYINNEVTPQMTQYIANNCTCVYENIYTLEELSSLCLCHCDLYELNGTFITDEFVPLFSAIK